MILSKLLKQKRHEFGLRQIDVAEYLGFKSKNGYWSIENGRTKLKAEQLFALCDLYKISADFFMEK